LPAENVRFLKKPRSTIGSSPAIWSQPKATRPAAPTASSISVRDDVQPWSLAWTSARTTSPIPSESVPMPAQSMRRTADGSRDSRTAYSVTGTAIRATGTFRKKIHSQPAFSTSRPPSTGPMPSAMPEMPAQRPSARPRSRPWKASVRIESEPGMRNAAPAP
jgi:hypothetical protein